MDRGVIARDRLLWVSGWGWVQLVGLVGDGVVGLRPDALEVGVVDKFVDEFVAAADVGPGEVDLGGDTPGAVVGPPQVG